MSTCINILRERLSRAGAVRALKLSMHDAPSGCLADDYFIFVDIALEQLEELEGIHEKEGISDMLEFREIELRQHIYQQVLYGEAQAKAAEAMNVALSPDSSITELDHAAKVMWPPR